MERFNVREKDLERFDRPEDVLDTPEQTDIKKRERLFTSEEKFGQMLALKATLEYFQERSGFLRPQAGSIVKPLLESSNSLREHASWIDIPSEEIKTISDSDLIKARDTYLEKHKPKFIEDISQYITEFTKYAALQGTHSFMGIIERLENMKKHLGNNNWHAFGDEEVELRGFLSGMKNILDLALGDQCEGPDIRKRFKVSTSQEVWDNRKKS